MQFKLLEPIQCFNVKFILKESKGDGQITDPSAFATFGMDDCKTWDEAYQKAQGNAQNLEAFWNNYYSQEWGAEDSKSLKNLGEAATIELRSFGFSKDTNPFLDYLTRTGYIGGGTGNLKGVLDAEKYSSLHNNWEKAITDKVLRGKVTPDDVDFITSDLISNKVLFGQSPNIIEDYLDLIAVFKAHESNISGKLDALKSAGEIDETTTAQVLYTILTPGDFYENLPAICNAKKTVGTISALRSTAQVKSILEKIFGETIKKKEKATNQAVIDKLAGIDSSKIDLLSAIAKYLIIQTAGDTLSNISDWKKYCDEIATNTTEWTGHNKLNWKAEIPLEDATFLGYIKALQDLEITPSTIKHPILYTIVQKINTTTTP